MPEVAALVLAAGASNRLGQPKQLVELAGEPLLVRVVRLAFEAGCAPIVVVLGAHHERCRSALANLPRPILAGVLVVENPNWPAGMSTSLKAGLAALAASQPRPGSTLVLVSDQLRLTGASLVRLLHAHAESDAPVTAARYNGRLGVPAIFRAALLPALGTLTGDQGARRLLEAWANRAAAVEMPEAAFELDTLEDLRRLEEEA